MRSLVTGASGYLGNSLVPGLRGRGHHVSASVFRGHTDVPAQDTIRGDLTDPQVQSQFEQVLPGTEVLYHLAGIAHQRAPVADYQALNVDATLALARQAMAAGVRRFIYLSSIKAAEAAAFGDVAEQFIADDEHPIANEEHPRLRNADNTADHNRQHDSSPAAPVYGASKLQAEARLKALCADGSMELLLVRPALVYGGNESGHLALLKRWVQWRLPPPPALGSLAMIAREDLVDLLCVLGDADGDLPAIITATDGERYSTRRLYDAYSKTLERRSFLPSPPRRVWRAATGLWDRARGEDAGRSWDRLAGESFVDAAGLDCIPFAPRLTFETSLDFRP